MERLGLLPLIAASVLLGGPAVAGAQISTTAVPIYHGKLTVRPAPGSINRRTGNAVLRIRGWTFAPLSTTDGVFPDQEPVIVAMGEESFRIDAGQLTASRNGKRFSYRAPRTVTRGIRSLRLVARGDGSYRVRLVLGGLDLSSLNTSRPLCLPMALIVGDDDGFSCVDVTSPTFTSPHIAIRSACDTCTDWPWIR